LTPYTLGQRVDVTLNRQEAIEQLSGFIPIQTPLTIEIIVMDLGDQYDYN